LLVVFVMVSYYRLSVVRLKLMLSVRDDGRRIVEDFRSDGEQIQ